MVKGPCAFQYLRRDDSSSPPAGSQSHSSQVTASSCTSYCTDGAFACQGAEPTVEPRGRIRRRPGHLWRSVTRMATCLPSAHARHSDCRVPTDHGQHQLPSTPTVASPDRRRPPRPIARVFRPHARAGGRCLVSKANRQPPNAQAPVRARRLAVSAAATATATATASSFPRRRAHRSAALPLPAGHHDTSLCGSRPWAWLLHGTNTRRNHPCMHPRWRRRRRRARCHCHRGTGTQDQFAHTVIWIHSFF